MLVFADFLLNYADPVFVAEIDTTKITPAPTHYFGKDGSEQIADLVFQCPLKSGDGNLIAIIIFEHQSGSLKKIPHKLLKIHCYDLGRRIEGRQTVIGTVFHYIANRSTKCGGLMVKSGSSMTFPIRSIQEVCSNPSQARVVPCWRQRIARTSHPPRYESPLWKAV